ncbi:MAG: hypothetical protein AAFZ58_08715 [Pseudomonadota bacterium]
MRKRIVFAAISVLLITACNAEAEKYSCESGHTLSIRYGDSSATITVDDRTMTMREVGDGRYRDDTRELKIDEQGPRLVEGDQVTIWGCDAATD